LLRNSDSRFTRGIQSLQKNPEARNEEKATKSIEGIGRGLLNAETPKLLSGSEIYRIWVMQYTKQESDAVCY